MKDVNLFDKSLIIITSDHGMFSEFGDKTRIPLFIKIPYQKNKISITKRAHLINLKVFLKEYFETNKIDLGLL